MTRQEFRGVAGDIGNVRGNLWAEYRPQYQDLRKDIGGFRKGLDDYRTAARPDVELQRSTYRGMIEDPTKRGYSEDTMQKMRGRAADTLSGARRTTLEDINRRVAASGMGSTGVGIRAGMDYGRDYARQQREALRDIDIAGAEAGRADLHSALSGLGNVQSQEDQFNLANLGMQQNTYNQQLGGLQAENQFYNNIFDTYNQQLAAYGAANQPGFLKQLAMQMAGGVGQGAGALIGKLG